MKNYTIKTLAKDIRNAVDWLIEEDCGCVTLKLDDRLAVCVGWSDGFDEMEDTIIRSRTSPCHAICAAIKVWTSDDMRTDLDWIAAPYYEDDSIYDDEVSISYEDNFEFIAESFLKDYEELKEMNIDEEGLIRA